MTAEELRSFFNSTFGLSPWPATYEVDAETYANCCQLIFSKIEESRYNGLYRVALGPNKGLMFKGIELILKKEGK